VQKPAAGTLNLRDVRIGAADSPAGTLEAH